MLKTTGDIKNIYILVNNIAPFNSVLTMKWKTLVFIFKIHKHHFSFTKNIHYIFSFYIKNFFVAKRRKKLKTVRIWEIFYINFCLGYFFLHLYFRILLSQNYFFNKKIENALFKICIHIFFVAELLLLEFFLMLILFKTFR